MLWTICVLVDCRYFGVLPIFGAICQGSVCPQGEFKKTTNLHFKLAYYIIYVARHKFVVHIQSICEYRFIRYAIYNKILGIKKNTK